MYLRKPLTRKEVLKRVDEDGGVIKVQISVDLDELINLDLEGLNDLVDERILDHGTLSNIAYKVVGHTTPQEGDGSGSIILEVSGEIELY